MANRKNLGQLRKRILAQPAHAQVHADTQLSPVPMGSSHPVPPQEMTMPMTIVTITADGQSVAEAQPLYAGPRGAPVPATGPGQWQQLHAAGRP